MAQATRTASQHVLAALVRQVGGAWAAGSPGTLPACAHRLTAVVQDSGSRDALIGGWAAPWAQHVVGLSTSSSCANGAEPHRQPYHATTILCVRKGGKVVLVGDGQVSMGNIVAKPNAKKIRRIGDGVVVGFAGSAADGLSLLERLETKLEEHPGQLLRAAVELAKMWRQDKALRFLQAELLVADATTTLTVSGNGDVLEPHDSVMGIGSGSPFAVAAARALIDVPSLDAKTIALKAMTIAADMCIYTNSNFMVEVIDGQTAGPGTTSPGAGGSS